MEIYLVRHPPVDCPKGLCYGWSDVDLKDSWQNIAQGWKDQIPEPAKRLVYSSPLRRCRIPAQWLAQSQVKLEEDLRELGFGEWEGLRWEDIPKKQLRLWTDDFANQAPPGGETYDQLKKRATRFWQHILPQEKPCTIISHTGWIRVLLAHVLDLDPQKTFNLHVDFGGITPH